jgi:hypothetical protein
MIKALCASLYILRVSFWFNPGLEKPANRANVKPPMFHHLKLAFSEYKLHDLLYEYNESWKPKALALQRAFLFAGKVVSDAGHVRTQVLWIEQD